MTTVLIKQATIQDQNSSFHNQTVDIKIENGIITEMAKNIAIPEGATVVEKENLHVSPGWFDISVSLGEPGYEDRETIAHGLQVAAKSGFTAIALQPNTTPVIDNQAQVKFVLERAKEQATSLFPIGALTKNSEGHDLAELFDMKNAGAIAFGDYNKAIQDANIQKIALQYVQDFDGLVISYCQDNSLKGKGIVNEGITSTRLGLKGIPTLAEELHIARNLFLLEYTGGKLHIPTISTQKSIALIKQAKAKGLQVTCSVTVHHLVLNEEVLTGFDSRYKVAPPLRDEATRKALIAAVLDNTIDCITSDHNPLDIEHKKLEFDMAKDGTIGLESAFGALLTVLPLEVVLEKLTAGKKIFGLPKQAIEINTTAELSFFTPTGESTFTKENIVSKSKNSAFLGQKVKGKAYGIYNNGKLAI
ncbi:MAG: dihydroorotase [Flavobacterium sp.]|uniref:dihydroorotase n=1 Tax=Flavobacterium sp. TaxID=239 RepID=UPI000C60FD8E|nr:dihydroorotase [Flavobacterium sp.]MBF02357.1 dihydroorotase [Flavobacterium sp.]|tara:strand:- start:34 stop:1287 length:1254 start_codon:yes stop_codon:yes gene_type:complete